MMQSEDKLCVVVLFGGMSSEHEVSRVSAGTFEMCIRDRL